MLVAPATARLLSAYAAGYSHDLLTNVLIATRAPVVVCPAMHTEMWEHPAVQDNLALLRARGVHVVDPEAGRLAGGDVGAGRLADPAAIVAAAEAVLDAAGGPAAGSVPGDLDGLHVLVTAGGTREPIDPVRFIGNRSSGKQGHALAEEAAGRGAPGHAGDHDRRCRSPPGSTGWRWRPRPRCTTRSCDRAAGADVVVMAAAVADFTPVTVAAAQAQEGRRRPRGRAARPPSTSSSELGRPRRRARPLVGFAAETGGRRRPTPRPSWRPRASTCSWPTTCPPPGVGFEHDTNEVLILFPDGDQHHVPLTDKRSVARAVLDAVVAVRSTSSTQTREMT